MGRLQDEAGHVERAELHPSNFVADDDDAIEGGCGRSKASVTFGSQVAFYAGAILALTLLGAVILFFATGERK